MCHSEIDETLNTYI